MSLAATGGQVGHARSPPSVWRVGLLCLTMLRLVVAARAPLTPDEAYYWVWSKALAPGYFDHPPMVALWIWLGTHVAGDTALGVRLLAPIAGLVGSVLIFKAGEGLFPGHRAGLVAAVLLNATLVMGVGSVVMTPDTPLLLFWTACLFALAKLARGGGAGWWLAVGTAAGMALDSKYTAALLAPGILLWLLWVPALRRQFACWQLWAGLALAAACFAPVVAWNAAHGWVSFAKQGGRAGDWEPAAAGKYLGELLAGQIGLATPAVFFGLLVGFWQAVRRGWAGDPAWALLAALTCPALAVFIQHAVGDRVQANWPAILYPALVLAAAGAGWRFWRPAAALGIVIGGVVCWQAAAAPFKVPGRLDVTFLRMAGWDDLAGAVFVAERAQGASFVTADSYGVASELALRLHGAVIGGEPRWAFFNFPPALVAGTTGILVRSNRDAAPPDKRLFPGAQKLGVFARGRRGLTAETYTFFRISGDAMQGAAGAVRLPSRD